MIETDDPRVGISSLLGRHKITEAVAFACDLHAKGCIDAELAAWLFMQARPWHTGGFFKEQRQVCEWVLAVLPQHFEALHLLGFHAQTEGDFNQAEDYYTQALTCMPGYPFSRLALAQLRMMRTRFVEGREDYEARFDAVTEGKGPDWRGLPLTRWRGESLRGKRVYIWAEQGVGDMVMFAGFLPRLLADAPARIALGMFPKLISVFARSFPGVEVEPIDDAAHHALGPTVQNAFPHIEALARFATVPFSLEPLRAAYAYVKQHGLFDVALPLGDLLAYYMPAYIPAQHAPYLVADAARTAQIRKKLDMLGAGRRIGISWYTQNMRESNRNIPLESLLPLSRVAGCHFVSLQHGVPSEDVQAFCREHDMKMVTDPSADFIQDSESLVALTSLMDEVVTIDNSNVHVAGALGIKTTLLLPKGHNYRWPQCEAEGTLWYKSVTTLRQQKMLEWDEVVGRVVEGLRS
jgi:hypothetical protein